MKAYIVYKEESDHARAVIDYLREFRRRTGTEPQKIDPDSVEGAQFCRTYDVVEYPTIIATDNQGVLQNQWRGQLLPTIDEVSYYVQDSL